MPNEGHVGASVANGSAELRLVWREDRYALVFTHEGGELRSVPSDQFDTPVFTDAHQQGELLFASGAEGARQWSMSVEPYEGGFLLDTACRVTKPVDRAAASCFDGEGWGVGSVERDDQPPRISRDASASRLEAVPDEPSAQPYTVRYRVRVVAAAGER
ncbi:hypothetical protein [Botrimarina sp.]|uniref:hypothetical protein n=1 Tax=Botrimarina sp. TaxID=2795802 RepID=UPI0032EFAF71